MTSSLYYLRPGIPYPVALLVDTPEPECMMLKIVLERNGWSVLLAARGREALRLATDHRVHVAVLALDLPDMSGLQLGLRLRERPGSVRPLPILFLCEGETGMLPRPVLHMPRTWFLPKPVHYETFRRMLQEAVPESATDAPEDQGASASRASRSSPSLGAGATPSTAHSRS